MSLHSIMYTLFNFAAANSSMKQLLLSFILTCTNYLTSALFLFSFGRQMTSVYFVGVSLNDYLKSKDVIYISDKNNVQNFSSAKS